MSVYYNPINLENEWFDYGIGDPFILRFNGVYYLYCSTKDKEVGIKSWQSIDLINWTYIGLVTEDNLSETAYAPEVVYWNGYFYMYTSPSGSGHYVLRSSSPKGPFEVITDNMEMSIDGSVFIDDDGKWYFTHAGHEGIVGREMPTPYTFNEAIDTKAYLGHWTEGSMIIKRDGMYYLTFTGNHVFSSGYRVHYSVSNSPLSGYKEPKNNPLLINVKEDYRGLGHSATVLGPDLDSHYITYHNLIGASKAGPPVRKLNINRLLFNHIVMEVNGKENINLKTPKLPDFYNWRVDSNDWKVEKSKDNSMILSKETTKESYTAEFNFSLNEHESEYVGLLFDYVDEHNNYSLIFNKITNSCKLLCSNNTVNSSVFESELPHNINLKYNHNIRIEKNSSRLKVYIDNLLLKEVENIGLKSGGKIGYCYPLKERISIGFSAFSNDSFGSSDFDVYKVIPGTIEAIHYNKESCENDKDGNRFENFKLSKENGFYIKPKKERANYKYNVNISKTGFYALDIEYKNSRNTKLSIYVDGVKQAIASIPDMNEEVFSKKHILNLNLSSGFKIIELEIEGGMYEIARLHFYEVVVSIPSISNIFNKEIVTHGKWNINSKYLILDESNYSDGKLFYGENTWADYSVTASILIKSDENIELGGVIVRSSNESEHEFQTKDAFSGYYVSINSKKIQLFKINYDRILIDQKNISISADSIYELRVNVEKNNIMVYLDNDKVPLIEFSDPHAFMTGKIGVRSESSSILYKGLSLN